jgi:hypothetical protein
VFADDAGDMLRAQVEFDSALLPPDEDLAWLRGVERLLCAATAREVGMHEIGLYTGLTPGHLESAGGSESMATLASVLINLGNAEIELGRHQAALARTFLPTVASRSGA